MPEIKKELTSQEQNPHRSLVQVRNSIECSLGVTRSHAASIANGLSNLQCDLVVRADGNKQHIQDAIQPAKPKPELKVEPKAKAEPKPTQKANKKNK